MRPVPVVLVGSPPVARVEPGVQPGQVPVVPVRIFGSFEAFGKGQGLRLGRPVSIVFGPPILPASYDEPGAGKERYQIASGRIMDRIAALRPPGPVVI